VTLEAHNRTSGSSAARRIDIRRRSERLTVSHGSVVVPANALSGRVSTRLEQSLTRLRLGRERGLIGWSPFAWTIDAGKDTVVSSTRTGRLERRSFERCAQRWAKHPMFIDPVRGARHDGFFCRVDRQRRAPSISLVPSQAGAG